MAKDSTPSSTLRRKGSGLSTANNEDVDGHTRLMKRVAAEQDDVLCTIQLVEGDSALQGRLFDQLVDLLVEGMFLDLRRAYLAGDIERDRYVDELSALADQCRHVGLLPLPSRSL
jgi:hypothetical protein